MVNVTIEGNSFKVKGTFDCGILGVFRDDLIQIGCDDVQDIRDSGLSGIDTLTCSDEELSAYLPISRKRSCRRISSSSTRISSFVYTAG